MDFSVFKENIAESPLLAPIAKPIAWGLPWVEFIITLLLIIPRWRLKGLYASLALMILFTVYVIGLLLFDKKLPCSCGGILQEFSWPQHLAFNSIFVLLSIWAIVLQRLEKKAQERNWHLSDYRILSQREHSI
jgi:hypothetical protein